MGDDESGSAGSVARRRVLFVNRVGFIGGAERVLLTLMGELGNFGYIPVLACPGEGQLAEAARVIGVGVQAWPFSRMRITMNPKVLAGYPLAWGRSSYFILQCALGQQVDLIHAHHPVTALYALLAARKLSLPLVLHVHDGLPVRPFYWLALQLAVYHADHVICVSEAARALVRTVRVDPAKVTVVYNGIGRAFLGETPMRCEEVAGPGPHIGIFGVVEPHKGQHVALESAEAILRQFPTAHFWIVGAQNYADKAYYQRRLNVLAGSSTLAGHVTFAGFRTDVARWMQAMDVVVLPSVERESFGLVLIEAMALGRPVVASNIGGTSEVVENGVTGLLVHPGNPSALARGIIDVLRSDRGAITANAAAAVRARFSPDLVCRSIATIYDRILNTNTAPVGGYRSLIGRMYRGSRLPPVKPADG